MKDEKWDRKAVGNSSQAALSILIWTEAIYNYSQIKKVVIPKEKKLGEAEAKLKIVEG